MTNNNNFSYGTPYIRGMYKPTHYFSPHYGDQYTYLQYWRRRMCYANYLNYYGTFKGKVKTDPKCQVWDRIINYTSHPMK